MEQIQNSATSLDTDEEDYEIYFLQPASSPYNIKEKLEEANRALFVDNPDLDSRPLKIKFKENLIDYEPDLTDDDVQSIESYNEVIDLSLIHQQSFDDSVLSPKNNVELNMFTKNLKIITETKNTDEEEEIVCEENSIEIINETEKNELADSEEEIEDETQTENIEEIYEEDDEDEEIQEINNVVYDDYIPDKMYKDLEENHVTSSKTSTPTHCKSSTKAYKRNFPIDCKSHCIEKIECDLSINRLKISEKPVCPTLKLIKRKCCEKKHTVSEGKLPCYSGLRSEYGLSLSQLEKRQRRKEMIKLKEDKRKELFEEYKQRKIQQNEEIFRQWLKNINRRKHEIKKKKQTTSTVLNVSSKFTDKKIRPTTSLPYHKVKNIRRPHTSPACVVIEVPENILKKGINIEEYLTNNNMCTKTLHLLSLS